MAILQCTELVPAVAAGVIQWARTHWPAEKICENVELCDASMLSSSQVTLRFTRDGLMLPRLLRHKRCLICSAQYRIVVACKLRCPRPLNSAPNTNVSASANADSHANAYVQVMAMVDDSVAMLDAANPTLQSVVGDTDEKCDTCKLIVTQVATMLRNPVRI